MRPRTFELVRYRDLSGVSGTGVVAEGCVFTDGSVALRWRGNNPATAVWPDLNSVLAVHGHQGATAVQWLDPEHLSPTADAITSSSAETHHPADLRHPTEGRLTPRPRPAAAEPKPTKVEVEVEESPLLADTRFPGEPGFVMEPAGWTAVAPGLAAKPEGWREVEPSPAAEAEEWREAELGSTAEPEGWTAQDDDQSELDLDELFGGQHTVRPPSAIADPSGLPTAHARGWAAARHLR